jgi:hypothetical protein
MGARVGWMFGLVICLCLTGSRAGAQEPARSSSGALTWEERRTSPPGAFQKFRDSLEKALTDRGADPDRNTYHFVVLFNTVRTQGPAAQWMRDVYYGLLRYYLVGSPGGADKISFVPFQLHVRDEDVVWNRPFSLRDAQELYSHVPDTAKQEPGTVGGNDIEAALEKAVENAQDPDSAIYIVLTDSEVSQAPKSPRGYRLRGEDPGFAAMLQAKGVTQALRQRRDWQAEDATGQKHDVSVFYRVYAPDRLKPLAALQNTTRAQLLSENPLPPPVENPPPVVTPGGNPPGSSAVPPTPEETGGGGWIVWAILGTVLTAALIGVYLARLMRVHSLTVGIQSLKSVQVSYGKPVYLGGSEGKNMVQLDGLPSGTSPVEKVARLDVNWLGTVLLHSEGWKVKGSPVAIRGRHQIPITRGGKQPGILAPGQTLTLMVERNR